MISVLSPITTAMHEQLAALKDLYVKNYGPLANFGNSVSHGEWKWVRADWPWHSGHYMEEEK